MFDNQTIPDNAKYDKRNFLSQINENNDRSTAIVGITLIDDLIFEILEKTLAQSKITDQLLGKSGYGPLNSLSSRSKLIFSLGLISEQQYKDISNLRKIRNLFAHRINRASFENNKVKNYCMNLSAKEDNNDSDQMPSREIFLSSVMQIANDLAEIKNNNISLQIKYT